MSDLDDEYTLAHFSMSNGEVRDPNDVAGLLREVAKNIERLGDIQVVDIAFHMSVLWRDEQDPNMTVYYYRNETNDSD
jgi:hypothetical protein